MRNTLEIERDTHTHILLHIFRSLKVKARTNTQNLEAKSFMFLVP